MNIQIGLVGSSIPVGQLVRSNLFDLPRVAAVIVSAKQDPTSFTDFNSSSGYQYAVPFFKQTGEGLFCFPINLAASGVSGVQDGANVTIQVIFDGGDGELYQVCITKFSQLQHP